MLQLPVGKETSPSNGVPRFERHRPEQTLLYQLVDRYYPAFEAQLAVEDRVLPNYVRREFDEYLKCGRLEHGFLRARCESCHADRLVAFSCKRRGFCPSCGARRMAESAALLVDDVLPHKPIRQLTPGMACSRTMQEQLSRVLSFPFQSGCGPYAFCWQVVQRSPVRCWESFTASSPCIWSRRRVIRKRQHAQAR